MPSQALDELGATDDDPGLRAAEQLVAGEADEIGPARKRVPCRGLVLELHEHARAEVVDDRQTVRAPHANELVQPGLLGEADEAEVRLVNPKQERRLGADRALVVGSACAVRRADLAQPCPRPRKHVGDPEAVADLDQLAARDEYLAALRES